MTAFLGFRALATGPYIGFRFAPRDDGWFVASIDRDSPAAAFEAYKGWRLVRINDREIGKYDLMDDFDVIPDRRSLLRYADTQKEFVDTIGPGSVVNFVFRSPDSGREEAVRAKAEVMPILQVVARVSILFSLAVVCLAIGLAVVMKKPDDLRAKVFFLLVFTTSLILFTFGSWSSRDLAMDGKIFLFLVVVNNLYAFPYFPAVFFHFCMIFPTEKKFVLRHRKAFTVILYAIPAIDGLFFIPRLFFYGYYMLWGGGLLGSIAAMIHGYFSQKSALARAQMKWILWGTAVFSFGMFFTYTVPIILNSLSFYNSLDYYSYVLPSVFFLAVPVSFAFAIMRFRLMDIDILFDTTFVYVLIIAAFFVLDVAISAAFTFINIREARIVWPVQTLVVLWFVLALYVPLRDKVTRMVKRLFKREYYEFNEVSLEFGKKLLASADEQEAVGNYLSTVKGILRPKYVWGVFFREMPTDKLSSYLLLKPGGDCPVHFRNAAASLTSPRHVASLLPAVLDATERLPEGFLPGVAVPLLGRKAPVGVLVLGEKESGSLYNSNDLKLLTLLGGQLSLSLESIMNRREAEKREIESLKERERLSREIHDGIGGSFSSAIMLADMAIRDRDHAADERLDRLKAVLVEGFMDLRNLIWTIEENEDSLGHLAVFIREKIGRAAEGADLKASVETSFTDETMKLPAAFRLNLLRIVQELTANVLKHAEASEIRLSLVQRDGGLALRFSDDGRGFDASSSRRKGYGLRNIRKRCEELRGSVEFVSSSEGTAVEIFLPFNA